MQAARDAWLQAARHRGPSRSWRSVTTRRTHGRGAGRQRALDDLVKVRRKGDGGRGDSSAQSPHPGQFACRAGRGPSAPTTAPVDHSFEAVLGHVHGADEADSADWASKLRPARPAWVRDPGWAKAAGVDPKLVAAVAGPSGLQPHRRLAGRRHRHLQLMPGTAGASGSTPGTGAEPPGRRSTWPARSRASAGSTWPRPPTTRPRRVQRHGGIHPTARPGLRHQSPRPPPHPLGEPLLVPVLMLTLPPRRRAHSPRRPGGRLPRRAAGHDRPTVRPRPSRSRPQRPTRRPRPSPPMARPNRGHHPSSRRPWPSPCSHTTLRSCVPRSSNLDPTYARKSRRRRHRLRATRVAAPAAAAAPEIASDEPMRGPARRPLTDVAATGKEARSPTPPQQNRTETGAAAPMRARRRRSSRRTRAGRAEAAVVMPSRCRPRRRRSPVGRAADARPPTTDRQPAPPGPLPTRELSGRSQRRSQPAPADPTARTADRRLDPHERARCTCAGRPRRHGPVHAAVRRHRRHHGPQRATSRHRVCPGGEGSASGRSTCTARTGAPHQDQQNTRRAAAALRRRAARRRRRAASVEERDGRQRAHRDHTDCRRAKTERSRPRQGRVSSSFSSRRCATRPMSPVDGQAFLAQARSSRPSRASSHEQGPERGLVHRSRSSRTALVGRTVKGRKSSVKKSRRGAVGRLTRHNRPCWTSTAPVTSTTSRR